MGKKQKDKSKTVLFVYLLIMLVMIICGITFYNEIKILLNRPSLYYHILFIHIFSVTLFFGNAVVGMLWEYRSLLSKSKDVILHTYKTVTFLDAKFSSPLLIVGIISGVMLSIMIGDIWKISWLFIAFILFIFSGLVWVIIDIPSQYKIKNIIYKLDKKDKELPEELILLLSKRVKISIMGLIPLLIVLILMVYKPLF